MTRRKAILALLLLALLTAALSLVPHCSEDASRHPGLVVSALGETNAPGSKPKFELLSIRNENAFPIRWRGNWSEVEGVPGFKAPTMNPKLPWFSGSLSLGPGDSILIAVGQPVEITTLASDRWRFSVRWTPYSLRERLYDLSFRHPSLSKLPRLLRLQPQDALNPTNIVTSSSTWLEK